MFRKRGACVPLTLEWVLLLLALSVFAWGLQAKLALYHTAPGSSSTANSMAKLSTENRAARSSVTVQTHQPPRVTWESVQFAAFAFLFQGHALVPAGPWRVEAGARCWHRYNVRGPDLARRPPPVLL